MSFRRFQRFVGVFRATSGARCRAWAGAATLALAALFSEHDARAADCRVSLAQPTVPRRIPTLKEAQTFSYAKNYADSRALYLWLLARDPTDSEARGGLARVDAWSGCWDLSEREYREVLAAHPDDGETRGGLVDLLMWEKRWEEAKTTLDAGLQIDRQSLPLRLRLARLQHWTSDDSEARTTIHDLKQQQREKSGEADPELDALSDDIFVGEASIGNRVDIYPSGYPNIYTFDADLLERWRRFEFGLSSHLVYWGGGDLAKPIVDGERSLRVAYHPAVGVTAALQVGFGNPGVVLPQYSFQAEIGVPIYGKFAGVVDYDYWAFSGGVSVHILNLTVAYEATDKLELAAHAWFVHVGVGATDVGAFADTFGAHVSYKLLPRLHLALYYTYGVQLDRDPTFSELFSLRSHVVTGAADWLIRPEYGIRGMLGMEIRSQDIAPTIVIPSVGASFYVHW